MGKRGLDRGKTGKRDLGREKKSIGKTEKKSREVKREKKENENK